MSLTKPKRTSYRIDENGLRSFLVELVQIQSINPPGNEGPVAALMAKKLRSLGLEIQVIEAVPGRPNVVARLIGRGNGPTLLLNGHMDVQPPGNHWARDPFAAEIEDAQLYGQGAMDMKAGLAAVIYALDGLRRTEGGWLDLAATMSRAGGVQRAAHLVDSFLALPGFESLAPALEPHLVGRPRAVLQWRGEGQEGHQRQGEHRPSIPSPTRSSTRRPLSRVSLLLAPGTRGSSSGRAQPVRRHPDL